MLVVGFFAVGLLVGAIWRSAWAFAFPAVVAASSLLPPWHGVGIEVAPWYVAITFGGSAASGVAAGLVVGRLATRSLKRS